MKRTSCIDFIDNLNIAAGIVESQLASAGIVLTQGGEPTLVPTDPRGPEWNFSAVGPTKLNFARKFVASLRKHFVRNAIELFSPGKLYPGEPNPRWAIHLLNAPDGSSLLSSRRKMQPAHSLKCALEVITGRLLPQGGKWIPARCPRNPRKAVWVLPLDHDGQRWMSHGWGMSGGKLLRLLDAEGSAGLRLPLCDLPPNALRRALTVEVESDGSSEFFLPPLLFGPFLELMGILKEVVPGRVRFSGYLPTGDEEKWRHLTVAADPGVIEINLPPCRVWTEYRDWLLCIARSAADVGLVFHKSGFHGFQTGTGGGNHLLFGGPPGGENPFFTRPAWVASILRYWQAHPSLAYLFTGLFVGSASQAPRPDESARDLSDLEMGYRFLERLAPGDHRELISSTVKHLHIDLSGNNHRSEISFDKFWNPGTPNGCAGLLEFRAIESLPDPNWMSAVALLWRALIVRLLHHPPSRPLRAFGRELADRYFMPAFLREDLLAVLREADSAGVCLPPKPFLDIWNWRFPVLLREKGLVVRRAHEGWPLLSETPSEGGATSRFVDTSVERLEILVPNSVYSRYRIELCGHPLRLVPFPEEAMGIGIRYRHRELHPCLHPGMPIQLPLILVLRSRKTGKIAGAWSFDKDDIVFHKLANPGGLKLLSGKWIHPDAPDGVVADFRLSG